MKNAKSEKNHRGREIAHAHFPLPQFLSTQNNWTESFVVMEVTLREETAKTLESPAKGQDATEDDPVALRHELLLHEIEAIDEYWGPTFR